MDRRKILKSIGATAGAGMFSSAVSATGNESEMGIEVVEGRERSKYTQKSISAYRGSAVQQKAEKQNYSINHSDAVVLNIEDEPTRVYIPLRDEDTGSDLGSSELRPNDSESASSAEKNENAEINLGHYVWIEGQESNHILNVGSPEGIKPLQDVNKKGGTIGTGVEVIKDEKHLVDAHFFPKEIADGDISTSVDSESSSQDIEVEQISVDVDDGNIVRSSEKIDLRSHKQSDSDVRAMDWEESECPTSFTSALVALAGCASGCGVCIGLIGEPATTIVTCAACAGCGLMLSCCIGTLAPESYCEMFDTLRFTASDPAQKANAQAMYDGCRGEQCVP